MKKMQRYETILKSIARRLASEKKHAEAFGYFIDEDDEKLLRRIQAALKPRRKRKE